MLENIETTKMPPGESPAQKPQFARVFRAPARPGKEVGKDPGKGAGKRSARGADAGFAAPLEERYVAVLAGDPQMTKRAKAVIQLAGATALEVAGEAAGDAQINPTVLAKCHALLVFDDDSGTGRLPEYLAHIPKIVIGPAGDLQLPGDEVMLARLLQSDRSARNPARGIAVLARWDLGVDSWEIARRLAGCAAAVMVDCGGELAKWMPPAEGLAWEDLQHGDLPDGRTVCQHLPKAGGVPCLTAAGMHAVNPADSRVAALALTIPRNLVVHCGPWGLPSLRLCRAIRSRAALKCQVILAGTGRVEEVGRFARTLESIRSEVGLPVLPLVAGKVSPEFRSLCAKESLTYFRFRSNLAGRRSRNALNALWQAAYGGPQ